MPISNLKSITLTDIRYPRGDPIGHFLAWISLVPVFISLGGFVSHIIFRRELQTMFFAIGLLISQFISETTKHAVQQSRPDTCELLESCDSLGWPSSHSQYMFFFAAYLTLLTLKGFGGGLLTTEKTKWALCSWQWALAVLTMYSRVYLGYHSIGQVYSGAGMGIVLGAAWFGVVNTIIFRYFPDIEESAIGRMLYIKDTTHIPNVLKFEYDNARASRKNLLSSKTD